MILLQLATQVDNSVLDSAGIVLKHNWPFASATVTYETNGHVMHTYLTLCLLYGSFLDQNQLVFLTTSVLDYCCCVAIEKM
jgi:hypothetical protein